MKTKRTFSYIDANNHTTKVTQDQGWVHLWADALRNQPQLGLLQLPTKETIDNLHLMGCSWDQVPPRLQAATRKRIEDLNDLANNKVKPPRLLLKLLTLTQQGVNCQPRIAVEESYLQTAAWNSAITKFSMEATYDHVWRTLRLPHTHAVHTYFPANHPDNPANRKTIAPKTRTAKTTIRDNSLKNLGSATRRPQIKKTVGKPKTSRTLATAA